MDDTNRSYDEFDNYSESPDDMLESTRSQPLKAWIGNHPLPEDNDRPAAPSDRRSTQDDEVDRPATDTNMDESEQYEKGSHGGHYHKSRQADDWIMISRWEDI